MKFISIFIFIAFYSCTKGGGGASSSPNSPSYSSSSSSFTQELSNIKEQTYKSSHSLTKADLDYLLAQEVITSEEHSELMQLAQK